MATFLVEKLMLDPLHVFTEAAAAGVTFLDDRPPSITKLKLNYEAKLRSSVGAASMKLWELCAN